MIGSDHDWFNRINVFLFRHKLVAKLLYPILKIIRQILLTIRGKSAINNLGQREHNPMTTNFKEPVFQSVFADKWQQLPLVLQKHYMLRPYSGDQIKIEGKMNIDYSTGFSLLMPLFKLFKVLVPYREKNIPVIVNLRSNPQSTAIHFDRTFYLSNKKPYQFNSYMLPIKENSVIEMMKNKIAWRIRYCFDGKYEILQHDGYVCKLFGKLIPLPLTLLLGYVYCKKEALSDNTFSLHMEIKHFFLGTYHYSGVFTIAEPEETQHA